MQTATTSLEPSSSGAAKPANRSRRPMPKKIHVYFVAFTSIFVALVLTGFSRRYFIPIANGTFSRPAVVHIHGLLFLTWTLLLLLQASLAATGRLRVHRKIGSIGAWLIIPMLSLGTLVAARDTVHDFNNGDGQAALSFFYGELADLAQFGLLAGAAMLLRYKPDFHKRLVIIGSLGLLGAAIGRIPEISAYTSFILDGLIASVAVYDLASHRRVHAATVVGTAVLLAVGLTEEAVGNTRAWLDAAHHLLAV